jgi:hypothetical protein
MCNNPLPFGAGLSNLAGPAAMPAPPEAEAAAARLRHDEARREPHGMLQDVQTGDVDSTASCSSGSRASSASLSMKVVSRISS